MLLAVTKRTDDSLKRFLWT